MIWRPVRVKSISTTTMASRIRVKGLTGTPRDGRAGWSCGLPVRVTPASRAMISETAVMAFKRPLPVVTLFQMRNDLQPDDFADNAVRKDALDAVTRLDPHPPLLQGQKDQDPLVLALLPDTPGFVEPRGVIISHPVPHGGHSDHDDSCSRLLQDLAGKTFHGSPLFL